MMAITVGELMDWLAELDEDAEVRLAHQPSCPFEYSLDGFNPVVTAAGGGDCETPVVYLVEGNQLGYLPGEAMEACER